MFLRALSDSLQAAPWSLDSVAVPGPRVTGETLMKATHQSASERLHHLQKDEIDIATSFAELKKLRKMVVQKEAQMQARRVYQERSRAKSVNLANAHRPSG